mmetsp:Transcript_4286/g.10893  ORF Transcript_4286/g.10893 Transcript_4286/m.10893 type:complete len:453 (-) Transcript_4286:96-1454(-)
MPQAASAPVEASDDEVMGSEAVTEYVATADWTPTGESQLRLTVGDVVIRLPGWADDSGGERPRSGAAWWWVEREVDVTDKPTSSNQDCPQVERGYVPSSYLRLGSTLGDDAKDEWQSEEYFAEYGLVKIHREMLADVPRTEGYLAAIALAEQIGFLKGAAVLDVGCGSGILSLAAARSGARKVYAVEASDFAAVTRGVVEDNGMSDVIDVIHSPMEDVQMPEQVNLIVSEWMGTLLIFEFMIESVIRARDRWLAPGGVMWPSAAVLFFAPVRAADEYHKTVGCWKSQYGFDMSRVAPLAQVEFLARPKYNYELPPGDVLADPAAVLELDMMRTTTEDLERVSAEVRFVLRGDGPLHGLGSWFDVEFGQLPDPAADIVTLRTGPDAPQTHWKQDLLMFDDPIACAPGDILEGTVELVRNPKMRRHLRVLVDLRHSSTTGALPTRVSKDFPLWL